MEFKPPNVPDPSVIKPIEQRLAEENYASAFYTKIVDMIKEFEKGLDRDHEVGARLVNYGQSVQFHIQDLGYYNPSLIRFMGTLDNGSRIELIQHVNQISFILMALPKLKEDEPPKRIGYKLAEE
ncbi:MULTISPECIES: DUF6173 family protein [Jeotgalibacillus]|uniref:DUF6173 family protein n=1 Tax=Jeotgalibacillus TaxID=157226 RepID=UPI00106AA7D5|nr:MULTISPECIES: DUF6173 family protein [Jeotgalibacillus]TFD93594.1 hypothetical protein E2491_14225 [Jeotgalibacillus sp. R-1-5s-1]